jgi:hypothetical protein
MLGDGRPGDRQARRQLADGRRPFSQPLEDRPARGLAQGAEGLYGKSRYVSYD